MDYDQNERDCMKYTIEWIPLALGILDFSNNNLRNKTFVLHPKQNEIIMNCPNSLVIYPSPNES